MENRIRIREAILHAKKQGKKIKKRDFAGLIFPYTSERSAVVCLNNYERGATTKMDRIQISEISKRLGVDANFLFGTPAMSNLNTHENGKTEITEPAGTSERGFETTEKPE
jgi:hypothetical protein